MHFDLTDLRLFLAVIQAGSITHGAAEAHLSLPAASERLRGMELAGGVKLLERGRRGVAPTEAGEALAHHARLILRQMEHMQGELGEYANGIRATIRLLANTAAITEFLPDRLGPWLAAHRRIDVDLKERQSSEIVKAISAGLADIGIISDATDSSGLQLRPFAIDRLVVVVPRSHPLATARKIAFADILQHEFVGLAEGSALQDYIEAQAARTGTKLKFRMRVRTFEGICRLAAHSVGFGIVPETTARRCQRPMAIVSLRLTDAWATRRLKICFRSGEEPSPVASDMISHLSAAA
ncbi:LysR family transcriptional regulator [Mesorhizobium sp. CGMCC 1.15528]|uniref:LysR family transcriptional regulator n=1 Tax=Mesorhizobium zhangyense TaxID=1776730 RepID=A0A7C9V9Y6_9HYPH|nr:LysR family transcriptional regulator [Mesorhizobium zhangyense]NGN39851.1 LysR family transcriptional regulator [Mesorhizobium zhangyense]